MNTSFSESCNEGQYLDPTTGCQDCSENEWSAGGTIDTCTRCPDGKEVAAGAGGSEADCTWSKSDFIIITQLMDE